MIGANGITSCLLRRVFNFEWALISVGLTNILLAPKALGPNSNPFLNQPIISPTCKSMAISEGI